MAITAYCGVMGSGKSYEVVSGPLLDAVASGRRVVTNVDGISEAAIHAYVHEKRGVPLARLGAIVHVRTDDLKRDAFFPVEVESSAGATVVPGFVQAGDLLVIDEAWKLWSTSEKISREHMSFFRMHRHFVHSETGVACDVILMIQSISDLHRSIKAVVELSFRMVKLKSLGLSKGYRVEMYETSKQTKSTLTGTFIRRYKSEIFPLYKSYAGQGGVGQEAMVDKRQNVLARPLVWVMVVTCFVAGVGCLWWSWRFFHQRGSGSAPGAHRSEKGATSDAGAASVPATASAPASAGHPESDQSVPRTSGVWRVVGAYVVDGRGWVVLADGENRLRVESPSMFVGSGVARVGTVEGERVTMWSGASRNGSKAGAGALVGGAR